MRATKIAITALGLLGFLMMGLFWLLPRILFNEIYRKEAELTSSTVAQTAGWDIAQLCQTCKEHPDWFTDEPAFSPAWTPPSILKFDPSWVEVNLEEDARIEFGGGFHHFGYWMGPASSSKEEKDANTWVLNFYSEGSQDREIARFTLTPNDILTKEQFVERTMTEFDRRFAAGFSSGHIVIGDNSLSSQRCKFAIKHKQIPRLRQAIRDSARQNPNAWSEVLLAYVIDLPAAPENATARLREWANTKGDFSGWLMAAYAFDKVGELDAAEDAVLQACKFPANDPPWVSMHARARGYSMCRRLYLAGKHKSCLALCENLLTYNGCGNYMADSILTMRDACRSAQTTSAPATASAIGNGSPNDFDPFAGIDIHLLQTADNPQSQPTTSSNETSKTTQGTPP